MNNSIKLKNQILELVKDFYYTTQQENKLTPSSERINYAGRVYDERELVSLVEASLDFWLTAGRFNDEFEKKLSSFLGVKYCHTCNSGSSANLLAFMALTSPLLKERRIYPGDEVITVAAGFPTTVAPIIQYGAIPVFLDVTFPQYNIDCSQLQEAVTNKTKAVMVAHTLGNPFNLKEVKDFCQTNNLWLIEDNCDSLGSMYFIDGQWKYTGTIGDIGTSSFYPPHHITTGEGGAVYTNNPVLSKILLSIRDWGRDCSCPSGVDNLCKSRFDQQFGELPLGYDHKYVYSHFGYNLKMTDLQAAIGSVQMDKLPFIIKRRQENWLKLRRGLDHLKEYFVMPEPCEDSNPSWFGFLLTVKPNGLFSREDIIRYLEQNKIQTRMLFAGNLIKHPCFDEMRKEKKGFRVIGNLANTDMIMNHTLWVGVYSELNDEKLDYIIDTINSFIKSGGGRTG